LLEETKEMPKADPESVFKKKEDSTIKPMDFAKIEW
jgi:hypothetical protein